MIYNVERVDPGWVVTSGVSVFCFGKDTDRRMDESLTNMARLAPSRKKLRPGDVFAMFYPNKGYIFGRVMAVDLPGDRAPMPGCNMVYIYNLCSSGIEVEVASLTRDRLLVAPAFINRLPWSRGYFQTIMHRPLSEMDILERNCFFRHALGVFVDLAGNPISDRVEPCGEWAMDSYRTLDDAISDALGIGRVPDDI